MGVVANARINEARSATDAAASVVPNVPNYALPSGDFLFIGVVENLKMNEERAATYAAAPVAPNVSNDEILYGGSLSMGVLVNTIINVSQAAADAAAPESSATINVPAAENPQLRRQFSYSKQSFMSDRFF